MSRLCSGYLLRGEDTAMQQLIQLRCLYFSRSEPPQQQLAFTPPQPTVSLMLELEALIQQGEEVFNLLMALGDDIDSYITEDVYYPHLKAKGILDAVVVEGKEMAETENPEEALLLLIWGRGTPYLP
ncbi:hypothetical protein FJT64_018025 [Amphibalanus amphitrite]|uniref:Uncharacterized protein n=1 Tax=Amphibalanus amphitrite TaxID=1232801 RepID=A0A6A4X9T2_AMPAM|nr:hypothetical protein FJT64_018025 [Amphibalanus amphitrite]